MQSTLRAPAPNTHPPPPPPPPWRRRPFSGRAPPPHLRNSLRIPINYHHPEEDLHRHKPPSGFVKLPVVVRESGRASRYAWDGESVQLVSLNDGGGAAASFGLVGFDEWLRKARRVSGLAVRDLFIPKTVPEHYMEYVKWKFLHRVFSSALQVLATQAMFRAIGIGYSRSLPSAAALNWVLKDGLGRLSRCIYTASLASAFDTNLKRVRFLTSIMFSLSIGVELLTPVFPQYFLLLATLANIGKQISLACHLATGSAVHRSFAIADNIGEVSAKAQIQVVCFDNLGLMLAAILNLLLKNNQRLLAGLPFLVYPIFAALDLCGIYQALKHVHLQTLTKDILENILSSWIESGYVSSPAEVAKEEGINFLWSESNKLWPIRIGNFNTKGQIPKLSMMAMQSLSGQDYYFVCLENLRGESSPKQQGILLCLREGCGTSHVMMGLLQACYIRKAMLSAGGSKTNTESYTASELKLDECLKLVAESKRYAERDLPTVERQMSAVGWATKNVLLSTKEQARYIFVDDKIRKKET